MWFVLAACTPESPVPALPAAWDVAAPAADAPELTAEGASSALSAVFATTFSYNADVTFRAYDEVMAYADEECPPISSGTGGSLWNVSCTSTQGARFTGFVAAFDGVEGPFAVRRISGEATIEPPDGTRFVVAGDASVTVSDSSWASLVYGVVRYDGPAAEGSWVVDEPDVNLAYTIERGIDGTISALIEGSIAGLDEEVTAVEFEDIRVSAGADWPCRAEPSGTIELRDPGGVWASMTFDVTGSAEEGFTVDEALCDGCAELYWGDVDLGEVCVDTELLLGVAIPPW